VNLERKESQVLKRDIRNLWHCESNQSIFIMMSAIASNMKLYETDMQIVNSSRKPEGMIQSKNMWSSLLSAETDHDLFWNYKNISVHNYRQLPFQLN